MMHDLFSGELDLCYGDDILLEGSWRWCTIYFEGSWIKVMMLYLFI